jgi:hypothetical protein
MGDIVVGGGYETVEVSKGLGEEGAAGANDGQNPFDERHGLLQERVK